MHIGTCLLIPVAVVSWPFNWEGPVLQLMVLPFSLKVVSQVFTKLTKAVAQALSDVGVRLLMYLDD